MLGWSFNLFRVRGIQLAVHASFFLLLAAVAWRGWVDYRLIGLTSYVGMVLAFFTCVVLHEFGHSFTAMRYGIGVRRILLLPIGGMAEFDAIPRQPLRELLITLAGPAVNFAIAALLWLVIQTFPDSFPVFSLYHGIVELFVWNIAMGIFNLVPAFPMDGGRILRAALATRLPYLRATWWAASIGKVVCIAGFIYTLSQREWMLAVLATFIFVVGEAEYRAVRQRELEDAHWRAMLEEYYRSRSTREPPLLPL